MEIYPESEHNTITVTVRLRANIYIRRVWIWNAIQLWWNQNAISFTARTGLNHYESFFSGLWNFFIDTYEPLMQNEIYSCKDNIKAENSMPLKFQLFLVKLQQIQTHFVALLL